MLLPFMGLLLFFIPAVGILAGIVLLSFKRLRFLAPIVFLAPFFGSYGAIAGLFGTSIGLEQLGFHSGVAAALGALLGFLVGGVTGVAIAVAVAILITLTIRTVRANKTTRG